MRRKVFRTFLVGLVVLFWAGYCMAGSPVIPSKPGFNPKNVPPKLPPGVNPEHFRFFPSIKTDLRWDLVRYVGSDEAIVRITATFTNVGTADAHCPVESPYVSFCEAKIIEKRYGSITTLASRRITTLARGQSITLTRDIRVSCDSWSLEFPPIIEAFHGAVLGNPDYLTPDEVSRFYDADPQDNRKELDVRSDICEAI